MSRVILISGLSCTGKSTLARNLADRLGGEMLRIDDYYRETDPAEFEKTDFEDPSAIDIDFLARHVKELCSGKTIDTPRYDFTECRYTSFRQVLPAPYLIVEGQLSAIFQDLLTLANVAIFLDVPAEKCLERRLRRDEMEFHRTRQASQHRFLLSVMPAFEKHRETLKQNSTIVLEDASQEAWVAQILGALST